MQKQRLGQNFADLHARVERSIGILEDELRVSSEAAQRGGVELGQILLVETD